MPPAPPRPLPAPAAAALPPCISHRPTSPPTEADSAHSALSRLAQPLRSLPPCRSVSPLRKPPPAPPTHPFADEPPHAAPPQCVPLLPVPLLPGPSQAERWRCLRLRQSLHTSPASA